MAITKKQVEQKTDELIRDLSKVLKGRVDYLLHSGAIDLESYEDNFYLPKIIINAVLKSTANDFPYCPPKSDKKAHKEIKNLQRFV